MRLASSAACRQRRRTRRDSGGGSACAHSPSMVSAVSSSARRPQPGALGLSYVGRGRARGLPFGVAIATEAQVARTQCRRRRRGEGGEGLEPVHDAGRILELAPREAEAFAGVVVEANEAEALVARRRRSARARRRGHAAEASWRRGDGGGRRGARTQPSRSSRRVSGGARSSGATRSICGVAKITRNHQQCQLVIACVEALRAHICVRDYMSGHSVQE